MSLTDRKVKCPKCGEEFSTKAVRARCPKCENRFFTSTVIDKVRSPSDGQAIVPSKVEPSKPEAATPAPITPKPMKPVVAVNYVPVQKKALDIQEPISQPVKTDQPTETTETKTEGTNMGAAGYVFVVEGVHNLLQTLFPDADLDSLDEEDKKYLNDWGEMVEEYMQRHGYNVPDQLELLPILLMPIGFFSKDLRKIVASRKNKEIQKVPKPTASVPIPEPTTKNGLPIPVATQPNMTIQKSENDMLSFGDRLGKKLAGYNTKV